MSKGDMHGSGNDYTKTIALTLRPSGGLRRNHEQRLCAWLNKHADQWEIFEETLNDDESTRHLHGRILLRNQKRMDKIKVSLITNLNLTLSEKKVLRNGIKWLYDDWEYAGKDGHVWERNIKDEDEWEYADPSAKTVKKKNAWIHHWLGFIRADLPPETNDHQVKRLILRAMARDLLEMPTVATLDQKCKTVTLYWNTLNNLDPDDLQNSDDMDD